MSQTRQPGAAQESEEAYATLRNNVNAVRAICSAVEGTLGPKGLDTMLVGARGEVIITNDGVTILEKMDVAHPAAQLLVQVARAQQERIGDGTTTATVLAGALVAEGARQVMRGVPVAKVVRGIQDGVGQAAQALSSRARPVLGLDDPVLKRVAYVAGREHADLADLIVSGARQLGAGKLCEENFRFADAVHSLGQASGEVWPGLIVPKRPANAQLDFPARSAGVLIIQDAFGPEEVAEEALTTESGYGRHLQLREQFRDALDSLSELQVGLIACERGVDGEAEQYCTDRGIMVLQRVPRTWLRRLSDYTAARPMRRSAFYRPAAEWSGYLGYAGRVAYDERLECVRIADGRGQKQVSIVIGASTNEIAGERLRIARDAAAALQAALRSGWLPGGGAAEIAAAYELERYRETVRGMEGFGVEAVVHALRKPLSQIVVNAGYNPLEKVEEAKAAQLAASSDALGIDCDTGAVADMAEAGIIDPADVKLHALHAAGEVASAVLRIHTVIKMRQPREE
ncbi:Chaperonin GroEL (HSP60 family) [Paenibacillus sp. UNCCL117]|uniref:TCP-1/cpn60 chaperonin family protein n=1 Tax=unclassified Paenibacillus TaxID=185978 RepID=UPI000882C9A2|nr:MULTISPECIES: TCP-1/cpn60 chaperonin family protein [unclassified Paenibacillus]SDC71275.1 Chaperonin GroEL (HSP60 family) [Paenibacillus sp. cl123]SFW24426.1 Chaperonin GroEL (HSP60 family) [Paenibacillus sp. UNCCL117]